MGQLVTPASTADPDTVIIKPALPAPGIVNVFPATVTTENAKNRLASTKNVMAETAVMPEQYAN